MRKTQKISINMIIRNTNGDESGDCERHLGK